MRVCSHALLSRVAYKCIVLLTKGGERASQARQAPNPRGANALDYSKWDTIGGEGSDRCDNREKLDTIHHAAACTPHHSAAGHEKRKHRDIGS